MRRERDDAREDSTRGAYECCDIHNRLRDTENELYYATERLQDAGSCMDDERNEFRSIIQDLNDQHLADQEEIRSQKQHVSNTECDRDEYGRKLGYALKDSRKMARENQKFAQENQELTQDKQKLVHEKHELERGNQQLEALLTEKVKMIEDLQAQTNDSIQESVATLSSSPIYIQLNGETEMHQPRTTTPSSRDTAPEQAAADGELAERDGRIRDLEQQNGTLTSEIEVLRTDLRNLRDEHGECSGHLQTQLAKRDEEMSTLRAEKKMADEDSAKAVAALQAELGTKGQEVEEANRTLVANQASSADNVQRLTTLSNELEICRQAQAQYDETSASQNPRNVELMAAKEQLEGRLRLNNDEIVTLQSQVTNLHNEQEALRRTHARCDQHASSQALQVTQLRDANGLLQGSNNDLSQRLESARIERANLIREGQRVEQQNHALLDSHARSQRETLSLQAQIETLTQTVDHQQQRIHTFKTNCSKCRDLRAALDAVVKDVRMSDDEERANMKRDVREELISQVPDDLRRRLRGEVERSVREEFKSHYSDLLARNTKRIQEQDRLIQEKDAELEKAKSNPTTRVNQAAPEKQEGNLSASNTKLQQDVKILQGNCSRMKRNAQNDREQLNRAQTANDDLRGELETIKADQRSAKIVNPLQSKLVACQREFEKMKVDRDKARDNCSIYSKNLSDLRKRYEALESERLALRERSSLDGDSLMEDGCSERPFAVPNESTIRTLQNEVARLLKELKERKALSNVQDQAMETPSALQALHVDEGKQQLPEGSFPDDQSPTAPARDRDEARALDLLRHEVDVREARDGKKAVYANQSSAHDSAGKADDRISLPIDGAEKSGNELEEGGILDTKLAPKPTRKPPHKFGRRPARLPARLPARQPTNTPVLEGKVAKKRARDEYFDGEADDEGADDRKKVKMYHRKASRDSSAPAQGDKPQVDKDME